MNDSWFDNVTRSLGKRPTRRGVLGRFAGATAAVAALHVTAMSARVAQPAATPASEDGAPQVIAPKVLTITMFQTGDPLGDGSGETSVWVKNDKLDQVVEIPGSYSPLYCNATYEHCAVTTGVMASNAASTIMAIGLSPRLDLTKSYLMVAGIGGGPPDKITVGSAVWADWVVSGDLVTEIDAREMPADWVFPKASLACVEQWCPDGFRTGTEVFQLDPDMIGWAFQLSRNVELADDPKAREYVQQYPEDVARGAPLVRTGAILGINDFTYGALISDWSSWWVSQWTGGQSEYCMAADEEGGIFTALQRLSKSNLIDMRRVTDLRVASDIDQQHPGQTAGEALAVSLNSAFGFIGLENIYRVASPVVEEIIGNWDSWESGPPPLPQ